MIKPKSSQNAIPSEQSENLTNLRTADLQCLSYMESDGSGNNERYYHLRVSQYHTVFMISTDGSKIEFLKCLYSMASLIH